MQLRAELREKIESLKRLMREIAQDGDYRAWCLDEAKKRNLIVEVEGELRLNDPAAGNISESSGMLGGMNVLFGKEDNS